MEKKIILLALSVLAVFSVHAQTLEKMNWFNEPAGWQIDGGVLTMDVTPQQRLLAYITLRLHSR